jgi:uncharacterized membrane protein
MAATMRGLRLGNHPVHPVLVHFPVACWTAAPVTDMLFVWLREPAWWQISWWLLAIGCLTGLVAMSAGIVDLFAIPAQHPAQPVALRHILLMGSAWCVLLLDLLMRPRSVMPDSLTVWFGLVLSASGWIVMLIGAYAGGRLVYEFGIGQTSPHDDT